MRESLAPERQYVGRKEWTARDISYVKGKAEVSYHNPRIDRAVAEQKMRCTQVALIAGFRSLMQAIRGGCLRMNSTASAEVEYTNHDRSS
jgi:hypothetical protein